jgi:peptide/nickel transport system ATP-binding protein
MPEPVLEVSDLIVDYRTEAGDIRAVDRVGLAVGNGEFLGIVGESGCGKSTLLFAIAQLLSPPAELTSGHVIFRGENMVGIGKGELRHIRWRDYSVVMQSAMNALNPTLTIGAQLKDAIQAHSDMSKEEIQQRSAEALNLVGIDALHLQSYPHQLSGGMRQRAMIAMALLFTPQLVIMDEPTSALDVVAQRALMNQIRDLQLQFGFAVIFVTHDMSLVSHYSDRVLVMYAGQIAESASTAALFRHPLHPYTKGLISAFPSVRGPRRAITGIPGSPPSLSNPPAGCRFHPRCPEVMPECAVSEPSVVDVDGSSVRCLLYGRLQDKVAQG